MRQPKHSQVTTHIAGRHKDQFGSDALRFGQRETADSSLADVPMGGPIVAASHQRSQVILHTGISRIIAGGTVVQLPEVGLCVALSRPLG